MRQEDTDRSFEAWLEGLRPHALPSDWKDRILSAAAGRGTAHSGVAMPRWLLGAWGTAWAAAAILWMMTPSDQEERDAVPAAANIAAAIEQREQILSRLLASNL